MDDLPQVLLVIETVVMWTLVCWSWRKVTKHMSFVGERPTRFSDGLAVALIGGGAFEHAAYNLAGWFVPAYAASTFGATDSIFMTALYIGVAMWILPPMWRQRG